MSDERSSLIAPHSSLVGTIAQSVEQRGPMETVDSKSLPENAYLPLKEGEVYQPMVPAEQAPPETTWRAIGWGLFLCIIFTVASAYSGLKVGQVMEAAIPISILAIGQIGSASCSER